jgi:hypothetical protein
MLDGLIENPQRSLITSQNDVGSSPVYVVLEVPAKSGATTKSIAR